MLSRETLRRGFSLIEMMITLAVVAIVIFLAAPSIAAWIQNTQIRSAAESMLTGIKLARTEALKRNATVSFQMMTSIDAGCGHSASANNWVVSVDNAAGLCDVADPEATPRIVKKKASGEGTRNVVYASTLETISFDALGRVTPVPVGDIVVNITNPSGGACAPSGPMRCLNIDVTPGGQARMCDPAVTDTDDPRSC